MKKTVSPPMSPYRYRQEAYREDPWKIFQEHVFDIRVEDKELKKYPHWIREAGHDK
jgi:hypothetical protein